MTYFTGIDVSLRSVSICVVDDSGAIKFENKVAARKVLPAESESARRVPLPSATEER